IGKNRNIRLNKKEPPMKNFLFSVLFSFWCPKAEDVERLARTIEEARKRHERLRALKRARRLLDKPLPDPDKS
ncbi:MAG: hypothetical protein NTY66_02720, partial [Candidatus Vogelbacteria bacterium]|nr:hypothetical protein [Candidatus Vogelbacteria bacterium]